MIYCSLLKAVYCASSHSKLCSFLSNLVKAEVIDASPGMNLRIYESFLKKLFNSFTVAGGFHSCYGRGFGGVHIYSPAVNQEAQEFPRRHSKCALERVLS